MGRRQNRLVLIHSRITKGGINITYDKYAGRFFKVMEVLHFDQEHRPHDPRNTFITRMKRAGVKPLVVKRLAGHDINDITEKVYIFRNLEWLREDAVLSEI